MSPSTSLSSHISYSELPGKHLEIVHLTTKYQGANGASTMLLAMVPKGSMCAWQPFLPASHLKFLFGVRKVMSQSELYTLD